jgi:hypothetical protein
MEVALREVLAADPVVVLTRFATSPGPPKRWT